ncbi:hypothetical protein [Mesorhizobium japonicum]|uniref:Msr8045 protein n=1 Tax=Mesorhizobium japonicum (strain LMG 29417 / CECT 9101 / MAFF 303099) TaxID=266835 RepID=Q984D9_RHILO|nr:hypothetical protein [Mesorhizobium japonicum]BAB53691.1 msr8045 [Mesorhizobium japonicum MAFF 303099]
MAVAKKDQERVNYAWMYGAQARKDGKERAVPDYWQELADAWLQGFDGVSAPGGAKNRPVGDQLEAELDESAVIEPTGPSGR